MTGEKGTPKGKKKKGRLGKYETHVKPKLEMIENWCRDGLTEVEIFKRLGVASSTFNIYKNDHPELREALKSGKEEIDFKVEKSLLQMALGYKHTIQKPMVVSDGNGEGSHVQIVEYEETVYGNVTAAIFWLKNRKPDEWRDKKEVTGNMNVTIIDDIKGSRDGSK